MQHQIVDLVKKFQSPFNECIYIYNKFGTIKYIEAADKLNFLQFTFTKLQNNEFVLEIFSGLSSDNIDNVFRLSYHMGLSRDTDAAQQLAEALYIDESGDLIILNEAVPLLENWQQTRSRLYTYLLLMNY